MNEVIIDGLEPDGFEPDGSVKSQGSLPRALRRQLERTESKGLAAEVIQLGNRVVQLEADNKRLAAGMLDLHARLRKLEGK